ncbi:MAG: hypothetical protein OEZ03_06675 [Alphaproteobacteria bacterium]|nr:hypothetical protein [Alphaproteobacteria bacterium]
MSFNLKLARGVALVAALFIVSACSSSEFSADPAKVAAIKTVAVVSFAVPAYVTEEEDSGGLGGMVALAGAVTKLAKGEEKLGNGEEVAGDAVVGFIEKMGTAGRFTIKSPSEVAANAEIKSMVAAYDQSIKDKKVGLPGTPAVQLEMDGKKSEFAAKAAAALGVDGVMMMDANEIEYYLYTGAMGSGQAKARGRGIFKLYDRDGNPVWESGTVVNSTEASAAMVAGGLNPMAAPKLHKSMGEAFADDLLKRYTENAGS